MNHPIGPVEGEVVVECTEYCVKGSQSHKGVWSHLQLVIGHWLWWGYWNALIEFWQLLRFYPVVCVAVCSFISKSCDCGRCGISSTSANNSLPLSSLKNVTMWQLNKNLSELSLLNPIFFLCHDIFFQCLGLGALFKISEQHTHAGFMYWFCKLGPDSLSFQWIKSFIWWNGLKVNWFFSLMGNYFCYSHCGCDSSRTVRKQLRCAGKCPFCIRFMTLLSNGLVQMLYDNANRK